jgi:Glycosyl hydrolase family 12
MALRPRRYSCFLCLLALVSACSGSTSKPGGIDRNQDNIADDLGAVFDKNNDHIVDGIDINHDGIIDGPGVDRDRDGTLDSLALDTDCDGIFDSLDTNGDGQPDLVTRLTKPAKDVPGCKLPSLGGSGGSASIGGASSMGGTGGSAGSSTTAGSGGTGPSELGKGAYQGTGTSSDQYAESDIYRDGVGYKFIANGWGSGWQSHNITWNGTSFKVLSLNGSQGANYSPAGYPTMFCGLYSMKPSAGSCGLPGVISALKSVKTGWRWKANGNNGQYNAAWDIWLGNGDTLSAYLMVWLRDPPGQQPAGSAAISGATLAGMPGSWTIWTGNVNGHPIVNYVREEGKDLAELEYDVMDVYRDAIKRNYSLPGSNLIAVAVGFEVWNGPITDLDTDDFYVDVK